LLPINALVVTQDPNEYIISYALTVAQVSSKNSNFYGNARNFASED
jgi:hypothetical protein